MKIVAKIILYNSRGQVLILQRSDTHPHFSGHFDLPGGEIDVGESPAKAVERELQEETGLNVAPGSMSLLFEKQQNKYLKHLLFKGTIVASKPIVSLSWEHNGHLWLTPTEMRQRVLPEGVDLYYRDAVEYLAKH